MGLVPRLALMYGTSECPRKKYYLNLGFARIRILRNAIYYQEYFRKSILISDASYSRPLVNVYKTPNARYRKCRIKKNQRVSLINRNS